MSQNGTHKIPGNAYPHGKDLSLCARRVIRGIKSKNSVGLTTLKQQGALDAWDTAGPAKRKGAEERLVREGFGVVS